MSEEVVQFVEMVREAHAGLLRCARNDNGGGNDNEGNDNGDEVVHYCEVCGMRQAHLVRLCGDWEYYRCVMCGVEVGYRVR